MSEIPAYDPQAIETTWQARWAGNDVFAARDDLPREQCYYVLEMFPYPSGKLHMGHVRNYSIGDAVARYKRLCGFTVMHPMGWDSFGLPAEQAAIDRGEHPAKWTYENIDHMRGQLKRMGFSYDWHREFATSDPGYAHREQQLFLDLVDRGLVYRKSSLVNWSTGLECVLANEQVHDGRCWRTGMPVIQKELPQWFLRTTAYAQELLDGLDSLTRWPEAVRKQQQDWLGRSTGAEIDFPLADHAEVIQVFTTRPDTIFGVTFMSMAPEHPLVDTIVTDSQRPAVEALRKELESVSAEDRVGENSPKKGVFTGACCINPVNGERVPVFVANFVLADYGTGAVMAVPAHDTRDFAFASAHGLPIKRVILEDGADPDAPMEQAFTGLGTMVRSDRFDGMRSDDGIAAVIAWLEDTGKGRGRVTWRYRDWGISRQRYWGNPIPYCYGETMGAVPVRRQDLPVSLPEDVTIDGRGNPLEKHPSWATHAADGSRLEIQTAAGREPARRETDTMDTFVESSWYFARYTCHDNRREDAGCEAPLDRARVDHWLPVDLYIGGIEHACMHLLYARFFQKALCDMGYSGVREPFDRLLCQGMVVAPTFYREDERGGRTWYHPDDLDLQHDAKGAVVSAVLRGDGQPVSIGRIEKMSKSKNNGVDPQKLIDSYGADSARLFSLFAAPPEKDLLWDDAQLAGCHRFLRRLWSQVQEQREELAQVSAYAGSVADLADRADAGLLRQVHLAVKKATAAMENDFSFNVAIAECMTLLNAVAEQAPAVRRRALETLLVLLAPMAPHICAELWSALGNGDIATASWPEWDERELVVAETEYPVQIKGKVRGRIALPSGLEGAALESAVLAHPKVEELIAGRPVRKLIAVPGKIINIVV